MCFVQFHGHQPEWTEVPDQLHIPGLAVMNKGTVQEIPDDRKDEVLGLNEIVGYEIVTEVADATGKKLQKQGKDAASAAEAVRTDTAAALAEGKTTASVADASTPKTTVRQKGAK